MRVFNMKFKSSEIAMMSVIILTLLFAFNVMWKKSALVTALADIQNRSEAGKKQLSEKQALLERLSRRSPSGAVSNDFLDQYVLLNDHFSSVITGIVNSSKGKSFAVTKILQEEQVVETGYKKTLYTLEAEASFIDIGKFLEKLEDAPLLTEVNSVKINRIDNEMKRCRAQIKLYSYVRSE